MFRKTESKVQLDLFFFARRTYEKEQPGIIIKGKIPGTIFSEEKFSYKSMKKFSSLFIAITMVCPMLSSGFF
jgi:hypothetical protein